MHWRSVAVVVALMAWTTWAQGPIQFTVADVNSSPGTPFDGTPRYFATLGSKLVFAGTTATTGSEPWVSDGTPAGTTLLKDVAPGPTSSDPRSFTLVGSTLYFVATAPTTGRELWKTDGTAAGTVLVKDLEPGTSDSNPLSLTPVASTLYFAARTIAAGYELWKSDGTAAGTSMVVDLRGGPSSGTCSPTTVPLLARLGTTLVFTADDGAGAGCELYVTDGTAAGTHLVTDLSPNAGSSMVSEPVQVGPALYFSACTPATGCEVWRTDGTATGTQLAADVVAGAGSSDPLHLFPLGSALYFKASDATAGGELWRLETTDGGLGRVADVFPGANGSDPWPRAALGPTLLFTATDGTTGYELWATDGTGAGTAQLADILPGIGSSSVSSIIVLGAQGVFSAVDTNSGTRTLWRTDGTPSGTTRLSTVEPLASYGLVNDTMIAVGSAIFFSGYEPLTGLELWRTDGTAPGTQLFKDVDPAAPTASSSPRGFVVFGDAGVFFAAKDGVGDYALWSTDGTGVGTALVRRTAPPPLSSDVQLLAATPNRLFFAANDGDAGLELWCSDGTANGTALVADIEPGPTGSSIQWIVPGPGSSVYFMAWTSAFGRELWTSDGTVQGTVLVKDIAPGSSGSTPDVPALIGSKLYFAADDSVAGTEPWTSDGSDAGTTLLVDLAAGASSSYPNSFVGSGGEVFFFARTNTLGQELYVTDGTTGGTSLVADLAPGASNSWPPGGLSAPLFATDGGVVFLATTSISSPQIYGLWRVGVSGGGPVRLSTAADAGTSMLRLAPSAGRFIAVASTPDAFELWSSDGTVAGTAPYATLCTKPCLEGNLAPQLLPTSEALVIFLGNNSVGTRWWRTDGTAAGTVEFRQPSSGVAFLPSGNSVAEWRGLALFVANDSLGDVEPWAIDLSPPVVVGTAVGSLGDGGWFVSDVSVSFSESDPQSALTTSGQCSPVTVSSDTTGAGLSFTCSATSAGGTSSATVSLRRDSTPPTISCPPGQLVEAQDGGVAPVDFPAPSASDVASTPSVLVDHDAGSTFPLGTTVVHAEARDDVGNLASCSFSVQVRDTTPPTLTCPTQTLLFPVPPDANGKIVDYPLGIWDAVDPNPTITASVDAGTLFPVATTTVHVTAKDFSGNVSTCQFDVTVTRVQAPLSIVCPDVAPVSATGASGAVVSFSDPKTFTDVVGEAVTTSVVPASGSLFAVGDTKVMATAKDTRNHEVSCEFTVTVTPTARAVSRYHFGCAAAGADPALALLALAWLGRWRRRDRSSGS